MDNAYPQLGADTQSIFGYLWRKSEPVKKEIPSNSPIFFWGGEFERNSSHLEKGEQIKVIEN